MIYTVGGIKGGLSDPGTFWIAGSGDNAGEGNFRKLTVKNGEGKIQAKEINSDGKLTGNTLVISSGGTITGTLQVTSLNASNSITINNQPIVAVFG